MQAHIALSVKSHHVRYSGLEIYLLAFAWVLSQQEPVIAALSS